MATIYHYSSTDVQYSVASITRSGSTATLTTVDPHNFQNSLSVIVSGANQSEYNGTFTVTVTGAYTLTYTVTGTPATPATGTIIARSGRYHFISSEPAYQTDPVTSLDILPAWATSTAPTAPGPSQIAVYNPVSNVWVLTDDFRGQTYYLSPDYVPLVHNVVGPFPSGAVTTIPLATQKERKIDLAYNYFQINIYKNITVAGVTLFGNDMESLIYFLLDNDDAALTTKPTKMFLPDRTITTRTRAQLQAIHQAWSLRVNQAYNNMETKVNAINAAANQAALDAVDVTTGWPA